MRENLKQTLGEMFGELEGKNITVNFIRGYKKVEFVDNLHIDIERDCIADYIMHVDELDENEDKWGILLESVTNVCKSCGEWVVFTDLGFDLIYSIR